MNRHQVIAAYLHELAGAKPGTIPALVAQLAAMMPEIPMPVLVADLQGRVEAVEDRAAALAVITAIICLEGGAVVKDGQVVNDPRMTADLFRQLGTIASNVIRMAQGDLDDAEDDQGGEDAGPHVHIFKGSSVTEVLQKAAREIDRRRARRASRDGQETGSPPGGHPGSSSATGAVGGATGGVAGAPMEAPEDPPAGAPAEVDAVRSVN